jgi:23S rRNA pseudouridine1911/1915/1917 synthase
VPTLPVPDELADHALDGVVRSLFSLTWGKARKFIEQGKVTVDGVRETEILRRVRAGSAIGFDERARKIRPDELSRDSVVHCDTHVIVVEKPSGISTIPYDDQETGTLDERVRAYLSRVAKVPGRPNLGVVHRIDKETSGLVVFTRTWLAKESLTAQFRAHTTERKYFAIVHGEARSKTIVSHILADRGDGLRGSLEQQRGRRGPPGQGQRSVTHIEVVERLDGATLVACRLETGRTHQIRVHLAEDGHPLVGERVYSRGYTGPEVPAERLMLHAAELGFVHPKTEEMIRFESDPPEDFVQTKARLGRR